MFFWTILAALMGIVMFGNWRESSKDPENFVAPVYQAMALNVYQQHLAVERDYIDNNEGLGATGQIALYTPAHKRKGEKYQRSEFRARSYLFCLKEDQSGVAACDVNTAQYIVTIYPIPRKYDNPAKMSALRAIAEATSGSRYIGFLQKADAPLQNVAAEHTKYQPLGAWYYILSGGTSASGNIYVPNYVTCNFPLLDDGSKKLGDNLENNSYMIALSLLNWPEAQLKEADYDPSNLAPPASTELCSVVEPFVE